MAEEYIDLRYQPTDKDIVCRYYLEPRYGITFDQAASRVAAESSTGTWTDVTTARPYVRKLSARVFNSDPRSGLMDIAYPIESFEAFNVPNMLSSVAGNIFGLKELSGLRLVDIRFPRSALKGFGGPVVGLQGIRKTLKVKDRPLLSAVTKPRLGLNVKDYSQVAMDAWLGGADLVKDDESLAGQKFNKFRDRAAKTLRARDKAEKQSGERKAFVPNITAETNEMVKRARFVSDEGGEYVMIDTVYAGWSAIQTVRDANKKLKLIIHAQMTGHAAFSRAEKHGISTLVLTKLGRAIGFDQLNVGSIVGKVEATEAESILCKNALTTKVTPPTSLVLGQDWGSINQSMPVVSGGIHPGLVPKVIEYFGSDVVIQMGGGIHGHPSGTRAGARAATEAIMLSLQKLPLRESSSKELQAALDKWK